MRPHPRRTLSTLLEEEALRVQAALRNTTAGRLQWASALLPQVLADAEARRLQREATGSAVLGVPTGLAQLDNLLGGLNEGLYLLAGAPGMGKTTLALQSRRQRRRTCRWWSSPSSMPRRT